MKVLGPRDLISGREFIVPIILPLRTISRPHSSTCICPDPSMRNHLRAAKIERQRLLIQRDFYAVVYCLFRRQWQPDRENLFLGRRVLEFVIARERDAISAEPQQTFLPVINMKISRNIT